MKDMNHHEEVKYISGSLVARYLVPLEIISSSVPTTWRPTHPVVVIGLAALLQLQILLRERCPFKSKGEISLHASFCVEPHLSALKSEPTV